ncbi:MAG: heterodisulfide reductase, partial [SAR202 cluster bacterium]|nr:heterodisulfide reductase [SAR202 cluster bacterium]
VDFPGKTACCGFPIVTINEKASLKMVGNHTSTAKDLGASAMVTPCPLCHLNLDQYQDRAAWMMEREIDLPIIHVPQLVGLALGLDPEELKINKHVISTKKLLTEISLKP